MSTIHVLSVCGSGTVSSTLIANHVKEFLEGKGYDVETLETMPNAMDDIFENGKWDFIITSTAIDDKYKERVPVFNGLPFMTGIGSEDLESQILETVERLGK